MKRSFILALCLMILFSAIAPTVLSAAPADYDYSREGSYFNTVYTSADILELIGYTLSDGERAYLDEYGALNINYETVTTQQLSVSTIDGVTRVSARQYTYIAVNGSTVVWTPATATVGGVEKALELVDGAYIADFDGADVTDSSSVSVRYNMSAITIDADDINDILNVAFSDATALKAEIDTYIEHEDEIIDYFSRLALYKQYLSEKLIYDQKKTAYDNYLSDVLLYNEELARYEAYLLELEEYNRIKENNDNYGANYAKYQSDLAKYNKYLSDLDLAQAQIKMLDDALMTKVTYLDRQLYACLFSNLVDEVVSRKDEVSVLGVKKEDIDACAVASANIRAILKPEGGKAYTELKTTEEKYEFYRNNYEGLRDNIIVLTKGLHIVYSNNAVRLGMHAATGYPYYKPDYTEKLSIFISQLICLSNALSTEPVMSMDGKKVLDYNTTFDYRNEAGVDKKDVKVSDVLENKIFVEDIANPVPVSIVEVAEPTPPTLLDLPAAPTEVTRPTVPTVVSDPGDAPEVVAEPTKPDYAPDSEERLDIVNNEIYAALISDLEAGLLSGTRPLLTESVSFTPTVTIAKDLNSADMVEVTFLDNNGDTITVIGAEKGSAVNYTDALPTKPEDITATYAFERWVTENGETFDLSGVMGDVTLYPSFKPIYKEYPTVGSATKYLDISLLGNTATEIPFAHFLEVAVDGHLGILLTADNVTLSIPYSAVSELYGDGVDVLRVFVDTSSIGAYYCSVYTYNALDKLTPHVSGITVSIPCSDETFARDSVLTYLDGDGETHTAAKTYGSGMITFVASTRTSYTCALKYSISVNSNVQDKLTSPADAIPGQTVTLVLDIPHGMEVELYYILLSDLSRHPIVGDSFVMPYGNIRLGATVTEKQYSVKFVSDGKVISERNDYAYRDTVRVPNNPTKLNDDKYSYTFVGWSPEITAVEGDVVYVAIFEAKPLPVVEKKVSKFTIVFYSALSIFVLGVISLVLLILGKKGVINLRGVLNLGKKKLTRVEPSENGESTDDGSESSGETKE